MSATQHNLCKYSVNTTCVISKIMSVQCIICQCLDESIEIIKANCCACALLKVPRYWFIVQHYAYVLFQRFAECKFPYFISRRPHSACLLKTQNILSARISFILSHSRARSSTVNVYRRICFYCYSSLRTVGGL